MDRRGALRAALDAGEEVLFTGCGSAYHIAMAAAAVFRAEGRAARALVASDMAIFTQQAFSDSRRRLVVLISRSGETTETLLALEKAKPRAFTLAVTTRPDSSLAQGARDALVLDSCVEEAEASTRWVTGAMLAGAALSRLAAGDVDPRPSLERLPDLGRQVIQEVFEQIAALARDLSLTDYVFLGGGPLYAVAQEARLKAEEMALVAAESYPALDYRHGPIARAGPSTLAVLFGSEAGANYEAPLMEEVARTGARAVAIVERSSARLRQAVAAVLPLRSGLPDHSRQILYLPPVQWLAHQRALARGLDPDSPPHLTYFVQIARD
jgi:glucosamine--fructose-6-phosphate aminotransferase (isomerizing)